MTSINSAANAYVGVYPERSRGNGNGLRVKKCAPNCTSPTSRTVYIFSGSKVIAEYDNGAAVGSPTREYLYAGSNRLARIDGSTTKYYHQDHLSNRLTTDSSGTSLEQKGHFPFGEDWYQGNDKLKFTTYERDSESGNDYAMARYNVNRLGRFSSPDLLTGSMADPQSLNRYSYTSNDPIDLRDTLGLCIEVALFFDDPSRIRIVQFGNDCAPTGQGHGGGGSGGTGGVDDGREKAPGGAGGNNAPETCSAQSNGVHSFGFTPVSGDATIGAGPLVGGSANGSVNVGAFHDPATGWSAGATASGGAIAYEHDPLAHGTPWDKGAPRQQVPSSAAGANLSLGAGIWFSNATSVNQLKGPFTTVSTGGGFLGRVGIQVSWANGIYVVQLTAGYGGVFTASAMTTNTVVKGNGCH